MCSYSSTISYFTTQLLLITHTYYLNYSAIFVLYLNPQNFPAPQVLYILYVVTEVSFFVLVI